MFRIAVSPSEPLSKQGFARPDYLILVAFLLVLLAVAVPEWFFHGARQGLLAIVRVGAWTVALLGGLFILVWLLEGGQRSGLSRGSGHLLRFLVSGLIAAALAAALAGGHGLGSAFENQLSLVAGLLGGLMGICLGFWLGAARFWTVLRRFCLTLLGSLVLGILGLLFPSAWGPDIGIILPILVFVILALSGRVVPPHEGPLPSAPRAPLETP